jgi:hypothetical protein
MSLNFYSTIWETVESANTWLLKSRSGEPIMSAQERAGVNLTILLNSACYVEGNLEWHLLKLSHKHIDNLDYKTHSKYFGFLRRLSDDLEKKIGHATGPDRHGDLFHLFVGKSLNEYVGDPESWEGIRVLFYLRNVLAHGRMASGTLKRVDGTLEPLEWKEWLERSEWMLDGGYGRAMDYLKRSGLVSSRLGPYARVERSIFCDPVADHFWKLAQSFIRTLTEKLETDFPQAKGADDGNARPAEQLGER